MNIYESFLYVSGKKKNQILISYKKKNYTYRDIEFKSKILRRFFLKKGINKGDVIGVIIKKSPEYLITVLALFSLGVKIVPLSRYYTIDDLNYLIAFLDMKSLITERTIEGNINCRIIKIDDTNINEEIREKEEYFEGYLYLLTSGSTGKPKVSIISERVLFFRMKSEYESFGLKSEDDIMLINTPLYHCVGFRMMMTAVIYGIKMVLIDYCEPQIWIDTVSREKPTYTMMSPNQISDIVEFVNIDTDKFKSIFDSFKTIVSTGAKLDDKIRDKFLTIVGNKLYNMIGSSETEFIAVSKCWSESNNGFCGDVFDGVEIKILNNSNNPEENGEIICKSNMVFDGYLHHNENNNAYFHEKYFKTGDIGRFENGKLLISGRKKNIIICSGVNIYPSDIENELLKDKRIFECYAFGMPNERYGEVLCVFISGTNISITDIRNLCLKKLSIHQQPHNIYIIEHFIKNEMGKIDENKMKELILENNISEVVMLEKYERI